MWAILVISSLLTAFFILYRRYGIRHRITNKKIRKQVKLMTVLGSGGHTTEMIELLQNFDKNIYQPRVYIVAETDKISFHKIESFEGAQKNQSYKLERIPRSREVGQSYITSILTTIYSIFVSFHVVLKHKPDLLILNGPGTCIPIALATALLNLFCLGDACIIYEESICRVQQLSLSGQLLYYMRLTDELIVQWPQLVQKYPMCKLIEEL